MTIKSQIKQTILFAQGKKFTIQHLAPSYDKISTHFTESFNLPLKSCYEPLLDMLGDQKGKKVIDLGCGTGWLGQKLLTENAPAFYHGLDISTGMIYQARKTLAAYSNIKLEHGDFLEVIDLLEENTFDTVILTWSLKFNNFKILLEKVLKILKPGGKLALLTETSDSEIEIFNALITLLENNIEQVELVLPKTSLPKDAYHLTQSFNTVGYAQTVIWNQSLNYNFYTPSELTTWAQSMGLLAGWDQILDFYQPHLLQEFHDLLQPIIPGKWLITKKILGAIAIK